jgi:hypothetical protein
VESAKPRQTSPPVRGHLSLEVDDFAIVMIHCVDGLSPGTVDGGPISAVCPSKAILARVYTQHSSAKSPPSIYLTDGSVNPRSLQRAPARSIHACYVDQPYSTATRHSLPDACRERVLDSSPFWDSKVRGARTITLNDFPGNLGLHYNVQRGPGHSTPSLTPGI